MRIVKIFKDEKKVHYREGGVKSCTEGGKNLELFTIDEREISFILKILESPRTGVN